VAALVQIADPNRFRSAARSSFDESIASVIGQSLSVFGQEIVVLEELSTFRTRYYNPPTLPVFPCFQDGQPSVPGILTGNIWINL
jgi:hypothetical protein